MAKMYGITGLLSGKMGSAVFRIRSGAQIVAQYNPHVSNPNTRGQQSNRASFKLLTQLAAIIAPCFGPTMGVNERPARQGKNPRSGRNVFFSLNYPLVSATQSEESIRAEVPMEEIQITKSFRAFPIPTVVVARANATVTIDGIAGDTSMAKLVLIGYSEVQRSEGVVSQAYIKSELEVPVVSGRAETIIEDLEDGNYTLLAYGIIPLNEDAVNKISINDIYTPLDDNFVSAVTLNELATSGGITDTRTTGTNFKITTT